MRGGGTKIVCTSRVHQHSVQVPGAQHSAQIPQGIGATRSVQCSQERPGERGELTQRAVDGVGVGDAARGMGTRRCESEQKKQIKNKKESYLSQGTDGC